MPTQPSRVEADRPRRHELTSFSDLKTALTDEGIEVGKSHGHSVVRSVRRSPSASCVAIEVRSVFDPAAEAAGFEGVTPHGLRAARYGIAERFGVMAAAKRLGHANASVTTCHYARASAGSDEGVADGLDERNVGAQPHGTRTDDDADLAQNWRDGDNEGPTEAA